VTRRPLLVGLGFAIALAAASLALPSAPGYDPWSWLIWGREVASLELSTSEGPAWKPLPVLVTAPLAAVSNELAPAGWLVVARAGAIFAVLLAGPVARRLAGGSWAAGVAAGAGIALLPGWLEHAAVGSTEGLLTAFLLLGVASGVRGRLRSAFGWCAAAALLRVEAWPFLAVSGYLLARRDRAARPAMALAAVGVPALWFGPELLGSGELLRSVERARVPNPGAPALAARPGLATLAAALRMPPAVALVGAGVVAVLAAAGGWRLDADRGAATGGERDAGAGPARSVAPPVASGAARSRARQAAAVGGSGVAWILIVAAMSELGFSGEARYLLPGAALIVVGGMAGLFLAPSWLAGRFAGARIGEPSAAGAGVPSDRLVGSAVALTVALALAATGLARAADLAEEARRAAQGAALAHGLDRAIERVGGPRALLRCGPPHAGPYRGPLLAWALGVHKAQVGFAPGRRGVAFRSRLGPRSPLAPDRPPGPAPDLLVRVAGWEVAGACRKAGPSPN
jgi:hypothetical protein